MNKKGGIIMVLLLMLVVIVLTSAGVLLLVRTGTVEVNPEYEQVPLLDAEFVPVGGEGSLVVKEFQFCNFVDEKFKCYGQGNNRFEPGDIFYILFKVETSPRLGQVILTRSYKIISSSGHILSTFDKTNNYNFASDDAQMINFADRVETSYDYSEGSYILEVSVENPLLGKEVSSSREFQLGTLLSPNDGD